MDGNYIYIINFDNLHIIVQQDVDADLAAVHSIPELLDQVLGVGNTGCQEPSISFNFVHSQQNVSTISVCKSGICFPNTFGKSTLRFLAFQVDVLTSGKKLFDFRFSHLSECWFRL